MKKCVFLVLVLAIAINLCSVSVFAENVVEEGSMGPTVTYTIYSDGRMVLSGTGTARQSSFDKDIKSLEIGEGIKAVGNYVFSSCFNLESVSLPHSLESIGEQAFYSCGITEVNIPENVNKIGNMAFSCCENLSKFNVETKNAFFSSEEGVLFDKEKKKLLCYPGGKVGKYTVPQGTVEIECSAFYFCEKLDGVLFPETLNAIGVEAFSRSGIKNITIPKNVVSIGGKAFENCKSLETCYINCDSAPVGDFAFYHCQNLKNVYMSDGIFDIGEYSFAFCGSLEKIYIPEGVKKIDQYAFYECDEIERIKLHEGVESIGERAFSNCNNLLHVVVCGKNTDIGQKAFGFDDNLRLRDTVVYGRSESNAQEYALNTFLFVNIDAEEFIFTSNDIFIEDGFLYGIGEKTLPSDVYSLVANPYISIKKDDETIENQKIGTGFVLANGAQSVVIVINGDTDGNGVVDSADYLRVKSSFLKTFSLDGCFFTASDTDGDGVLTSTDYLKIKSHFYGVLTLE